jgi:hypothetical protein
MNSANPMHEAAHQLLSTLKDLPLVTRAEIKDSPLTTHGNLLQIELEAGWMVVIILSREPGIALVALNGGYTFEAVKLDEIVDFLAALAAGNYVELRERGLFGRPYRTLTLSGGRWIGTASN